MTSANLPAPRSEEELDDLLSVPGEATIAALARVEGDIVVLGAGGKMGPTLARMAARARDEAGSNRRIIAVSRFSTDGTEYFLNSAGVETVKCDLLDRDQVARLPDAPNVVFMAGQKFGTRDAPSRTWMMNVVVPAICAERYAGARVVVFSTGNVYPLTPVSAGGARETDATAPVGEYAQSCVGRERVFEHFAATRDTKAAIVRLNYAIALRYGVLTDLALKVAYGQPVPLAMGHVNVIWQGDANAAALALLAHVSNPPLIVNVTGSATLPVRVLATSLGERLGRTPTFEGVEAPDALLSNTEVMRRMLGDPSTTLGTMLDWTADWVKRERPLLGRATHF
ncbi:MAG TPA: NAD-dependent epimerase/dehydratase family protein, partial [Gemmatimonadaceae bacterium]|nr:NAD-dependent epimerase/dehydratase family protein [Gemmatimonadaceae bacterium]